MKLDVQTLSVDLDKGIFGQEPRKDILHRMVRYQLAKRQAGTHQVQERGDVSKTTKRIGRQKGGGSVSVPRRCQSSWSTVSLTRD